VSKAKKTSTSLTMYSFRADEELVQALKELVANVGSEVTPNKRRSFAIRKALLEARGRLSKG
jgi:predicted protein tyrosine phosphatase